MIKKFIVAACLLGGVMAKGQVFLDAGVKGAVLPSLSINGNVLSNDAYKKTVKLGNFYGAKLGVNFSMEHSVCAEILWTTLHHKTAIMNTTTNEETPFLTTMNFMQIPVMYRFSQENGGYSEIGLQFTTVTGAKNENGGISSDVKNQFNKTNTDLVVGFGQYIGGGGPVGFNLGFRAAYNFSDLISDDFQGAAGNAIYHPNTLEAVNDFTYKATRNLYVGIALELNLNIGYFTQGPNCHKGTRFKFF